MYMMSPHKVIRTQILSATSDSSIVRPAEPHVKRHPMNAEIKSKACAVAELAGKASLILKTIWKKG